MEGTDLGTAQPDLTVPAIPLPVPSTKNSKVVHAEDNIHDHDDQDHDDHEHPLEWV